jgi:hypothetical protein
MLCELEQGMNPTFYYNDWYSDQDKISVSLSTAKFKKAYREFVACVGNLLLIALMISLIQYLTISQTVISLPKHRKNAWR